MEQTLIDIFKGIDKTILSILISSFIAFLCWIVKGLVELPLSSSKDLYFKHFERRIEVLGDIKTRLSIIALAPGKESKMYKEQLQELLLRGNAAYLDNDIFTNILNISVHEDTNEKNLVKAIQDVNAVLTVNIGKMQQSNDFYLKYGRVEPAKRFAGYLVLCLNYIIILCVFLALAFGIYYGIILGSICVKILTVLIYLALIFGLNKWLDR